MTHCDRGADTAPEICDLGGRAVTLLLVALGWLLASVLATVAVAALCRAGAREDLDRQLVD